ncbi:hypothetical protein [Nannocystis pusilla]|uniref:hypothetical protein n=1 Tax=Nannocystis pusilla TaxID=889268 RepID=UPI003B7C8BB4
MIHRLLFRTRTTFTLVALAHAACGGDGGGSETDATGSDTSGAPRPPARCG